MLEIHLDALGVDADAPNAEQIAAGAPPVVAAQIVGGTALPLADPQNPSRPLRFPSAAVNFALNKQAALEFAKLLTDKANELPNEPSGKVITASSMSEAERVAAVQGRLTKP